MHRFVASRGWLESKRYPDSTGPDYTYTAGGRLKTRSWARGNPRTVTTYNYGFDDGVSNNDHGDLVGITYSNDPASTPSVTYSYDRRGRKVIAVQGGLNNAMAYNEASQLTTDGYSGSVLDGLALENAYDNCLRRTSCVLKKNGTVQNTVNYGYDAASRLAGVTNGNYSADYVYLANSALVEQINFRANGAVRMNTLKQSDQVNRLTSIQSAASGANQLPQAFGYQYDFAGQRQRVTLADGAFWRYEYDALGQVKSGKKYWADGTPVAGQQFEYGHDDIGNRTDTKAGGDPSGAGLRPASYSATSLNQYSSRTNPGAVDVLGQALVSATVTVNGNATYRKNDYFQHALSVANSGGPVAQSVTVAASLNGTNATPGTGYVLVPQAQEAFQYDADGNLTSDSLWSYTWDAENRLLTMESKLASLPSASLAKRVEFTYDWQGRRVRKLVKNSSQQVISDTRFVYDGWNLVAELNSDLSLKTSYSWGLDLSGSIQGAGGVGGLLFAVYYSPSTEGYFPAYDGNGNIMALCKGSDGSWAAQYEYGPFGELIRATGLVAKANPFRFSTKYQDEETGLVYYGYRFYSPGFGRWLSRDPIEEHGGGNLYGFLGNDPFNDVDLLGNVGYNFDVNNCTLKVILTWTLEFEGKKWKRYPAKEQQWRARVEPLVEGYFNNLSLKCKPQGTCCPCSGGVKIDFDLKIIQGDAGYDVYVNWDNIRDYVSPGARSGLDRWSLDSNGNQTPVIHEVGHMLGLQHPGHYLNKPPTPNSLPDYTADSDSLMGMGMALRNDDFDRAFCNHINFNNGVCSPWSCINK